MPLPEPSWWYRDNPTLLARALSPISRVWAAEAERRFRRAEAWHAPVPVVCVGNLTAGGTGKTPLSLMLAQSLTARGIRPAILTRGYGGAIAGPHWVAPGHDTAAEVGDEPLLLAAAAPTMVSRDRAAGARAIVSTGARHGAIVMDDGLQNGTLAKDLRLAVVDARRGIGNGLVMPAGPLRARLAFQLGLIDAVVVNAPFGAPSIDPAGSFATWLRSRFDGPVIDAQTRPVGDAGWLAGAEVVAYSGIGAPERFFGLLESLGARLVGRHAFPDHHAFTDGEARRLLAEAQRTGAALCTTEKDFVRLPGRGERGQLKAASRVLAIGMHFGERDAARLQSLIDGLLVAHRPVGP